MAALIMFDFDGVIADSYAIAFREFTAICSELGFDKINSREAFLRLFENNLVQELVKAGFPIWRLKKLLRTFNVRLAEANRKVQPFAGMPELLNELAGAQPVYIISSNVTSTVEQFLDKFHVAGIRDILGADKEVSKVKKIKRVMKLHREHAPYYIGDTKGDMLEGRKARVRTVAVTWGWHSVATLQTGAPDYLVESPAGLRALLQAEHSAQS